MFRLLSSSDIDPLYDFSTAKNHFVISVMDYAPAEHIILIFTTNNFF